jgi:hypothetical protein
MHVLFARNKWLKVSEGTYAAGAGLFDLTTPNAFSVLADLSAYQDGNHILWANDGTNTLMAWISATAPGGETLEVTERAVNGSFTSGDVSWTKGANWAIVDQGGGDYEGVGTATVASLYQTYANNTINALYKATGVCTAYTSGEVCVYSRGSLSKGTMITGTGAMSVYATILIASQTMGFTCGAAFTGRVDDFSYKRVTDCAATGALLLSTKGGARGFISLPAAFNGSLAGTYRVLRSY